MTRLFLDIAATAPAQSRPATAHVDDDALHLSLLSARRVSVRVYAADDWQVSELDAS